MTTTSTTHHFTTAEAVKFIKRQPAKVQFALHIRVDLPIAEKPDHIFPSGGCTYMKLSRKQAIKVCSELVSKTMEDKGGRLPITEHGANDYRCIWIG